MELAKLTNAELVSEYNSLPGVKKKLTSWKGKKEALIERIVLVAKANIGAGQPVTVTDAAKAISDGVKKGAAKAIAAGAAKPPRKRAKKGDGGTKEVGKVRALSEKLLRHVDYHEDRTKPPSPENRVKADDKAARSVGLSFSDILGRVTSELKTETTYACLRWYAVHMRRNGDALPGRRPKSSWK